MSRPTRRATGKGGWNPYRALGLGLVLGGTVFAPIAYFLIASVPFAAIGISAIMLGFTCMALANARPYISPEASEVILRTGMENTAALLEELGLQNKAVYLPSTLRDGHPQALIPLSGTADLTRIRARIPGRLIVRWGDDPEDMAIAVTTPGSAQLEKMESRPGSTAAEIESAITYVLVGVLDLANAVTVSVTPGRVDIGVVGARLQYEDAWYYRCLGSPVASIAATIACEALGKPVRIIEESPEEKRSRIVLEVLG